MKKYAPVIRSSSLKILFSGQVSITVTGFWSWEQVQGKQPYNLPKRVFMYRPLK
ncbi:hypothetical protein D3C81_2333490 [compost metagenome]